MKLQRDIFIVAVVCQLHAGITEADKSVENETPETYDKNLIQVVDDSVISRFSRGLHYGSGHLGCLCVLYYTLI